MGLRVQPDDGPLVEFLPGGSRLTEGETPEELMQAALMRLRESNRASPARPKSIAIRGLEDGMLWLKAFSRGEVR